MKRIRLRVKEVAAIKGFSQGRLSRAADITQNTVRSIYADPYKDVALKTLVQLANALKVPLQELYVEEEVEEDE